MTRGVYENVDSFLDHMEENSQQLDTDPTENMARQEVAGAILVLAGAVEKGVEELTKCLVGTARDLVHEIHSLREEIEGIRASLGQ